MSALNRQKPRKLAALSGRLSRALLSWESLFVAGLTCVMALLCIFNTPLLEHIELKCWDLHFLSRGVVKPTGTVAFVAVDEESVNSEGRWPWPRRQTARLIEAVDRSGPLVIGLDFGFFEPDQKIRRNAIRDLQRDLGNRPGKGIPPDLLRQLDTMAAREDDDEILAQTIRGLSAPIVVGNFFYAPGSPFVSKPPPAELLDKFKCGVVMSRGETPLGKLLEQPGIKMNIPEIIEATPYGGSLNVFPDPDGSVRWMPLLFRYEGRIFPSLALEMICAAMPDLPLIVKLDRGGVEGLRLGPVDIPTNSKGELLVNFYGPQYSFTHYSAGALLRGELPRDCLKDKLVVIGITTMGLYDMRSTPFDAVLPGVELHCTVMENILQQQFVIRSERNALVYDLGALGGIALIFLLVQYRARGVLLAGVSALLFGGYIWFTHHIFLSQGLWLNNLYPPLNLAFAYMGTTMHRYLSEEKKKRQIRQAFGLYVPESVVEEMLAHPERLRVGGEKKELSILFSDIRGFTSLSEKLTAEEVVLQLNGYLTRMTEVVFAQQGTLDKYIGDAIMAIFGAPMPQEDHAVRACRTALGMIEALRSLQEDWKEKGLPVLDIGIGIHTGMAVVGNMGSERRMDYTAIGDNVNLASRLEGLTKKYGVSIVVSESTLEGAEELFVARVLDVVRVKGKQQPVRIYELICPRLREAEFSAPLELYNRGVELFYERKWQEAQGLFQEVEKRWPGDPPSRFYLSRCAKYLDDPPGEDWIGVTTLDQK